VDHAAVDQEANVCVYVSFAVPAFEDEEGQGRGEGGEKEGRGDSQAMCDALK
jgi:hypothetical protein